MALLLLDILNVRYSCTCDSARHRNAFVNHCYCSLSIKTSTMGLMGKTHYPISFLCHIDYF